MVRDRKVGNPGNLILSYDEAIQSWCALDISSRSAMRFVDLTGNNLIRLGIDTDVIRGRSQALARQLSRALHDNVYEAFDGILYESRITSGACVAIYDRALSKLSVDNRQPFEAMMPLLGPIYRSMNVAVRRRSTRLP